MTMTGLYVPLITPFTPSGEVALETLESLAHEVLDAGAAGLVALGTTGEPSALTAGEQRAVLDVACRVSRGRSVPLVAGAGTPEAVYALGGRPEVTAALSVVPPFIRPGEDGVVAHFASLAAASPVPILVYDVPYRTGQYLSAPALLRLAALPGVAGVKYAAGGINADTVAMLAGRPAGFPVLGGDDPFISPLLALGADGGILASAQVATGQFAALIAAWRAGDAAAAREFGHRLSGLSAALFAEPNPTVIKAVLHARGRIPSAAVRSPLLPAQPESLAEAQRRLEEVECASAAGWPRPAPAPAPAPA